MAAGLVQETDVRLPQGNLRQRKLDQIQGAREAGKEPAGLLAEKEQFQGTLFFTDV